MKKILLTFLIAITATYSANNLKILNDVEDSGTVESSSGVDKEGYSNQYKLCLDNSGGITSEMRNCNADELKFQDNLLNKYYKRAMKVLDGNKRKELKQVQRQWIKYRDAKCGFDYGLTGGTMDIAIGDGCLVDMTAKRANELKSIVDMLE